MSKLNNEDRQLIIGSHVPMTKNQNYLLGSAKITIKNQANALMVYTGAPQNSLRTPVANLQVNPFHQLLTAHQIKRKNIIVHAPYLIINLANTLKPDVFNWSVRFLKSELQRTFAIGSSILVLHPGSSGPVNPKIGLDQLINGLDQVLANQTTVKIALETMSGKGSQIGVNFEQLKYVIDRVQRPELVGVCWDTCHLFDANYDIKNQFPTVLNEFKTKIGLNKLLVIHVNDSQLPLGGKKDRHANIGYGYIGFDALLRIIYHPEFAMIPKILETPFVNKQSPYQQEIAMIRNHQFSNPFPSLKLIP